MNWVLDHLQLLFVAAGAIAWWLNLRRQTLAEKDSKPPRADTFEDPDLAERTRRIREDIQKRIEERTRGLRHPLPETERRISNEGPPMIEAPVPKHPQPRLVPRSQLEAQRNAEILEQQAALAEQLRQAKTMKAAAVRRLEYESQLSTAETVPAATRDTLLGDLRDPSALRRAFVLREILGPPVALRR